MCKQATEQQEKNREQSNKLNSSDDILSTENKRITNAVIEKYNDIFQGRGKQNNFQRRRKCDACCTEDASVPISTANAINTEIERLEEEDIIEKVSGPQGWISNFDVVSKKNNKVRLCLDARTLNTAIKREKYPIPTVDSIIDSMHGSKIFAKLDMKEAYTQLELSPDSREITNFNTENGVYRHKRLVYGINNSFEIFQRTMEQSFGVIDGVRFISDDIIIYAKDEKDLIQKLETVFQRIRELGLKLNKSKCEFVKDRIKFFGIEISKDGINADPEKISVIQNAKAPSSVSELRSFLGLCNYVSRFIKSFSEKTAVLRELLKKNQKFEWKEVHQAAFENMKNELSSTHVLSFYDPTKQVQLVTDASNYAVGGILLQSDGSEMRPIHYVSRSLSPSEMKYSITEKEALALVWRIEKLHLYLYGKTFNVIVDHQALKYIFSSRSSNANARITRWQLKLQAYDFNIAYQKGEKNIADFLSRNCGENIYDENDSMYTTKYLNFLCEKHVPKTMTLQQIKDESKNDKEISALRNALLTGKWHDNPTLKPFEKMKNEFLDSDGIVLRGKRILLPKSMRKRALNVVHEGHLGIEKCKNLLRAKVYWPGMDTDVTNHINSCIPCQANSKSSQSLPIQMSELPDGPLDEIALDFFGPLPSGETLLVIEDLYSRFPFIEVMKTTTATSVINRLEKLFAIYGYPNKVRTDNGSPFQGKNIKEYFNDCGIKHMKITPRYPQANGTIERFMQVIGKCVKTSRFNGKDWKTELNNMLRNYRTAPHKVTQKSPSLLLFNREIRVKIPTIEKPAFDREAKTNQSIHNEKAKRYFDKKRNAKSIEIQIGDSVILKRSQKGNKFDSKYYNKIYVVKQRKHSMVILEDDSGQTLCRNISFVKKIDVNNADENKHSRNYSKSYPRRIRQSVHKYIVKN